jgi:uroporphyrinogen decarboxylase
VRRLDVDAAILFADILLPLVPMGIDLSFSAGEGPVIANPVRSMEDVRRLRPVEPRESLAPVLEAVRLIRRELDGKTPLIGFAGGPFTLASYMIEGGSTRAYVRTKQLMYSQPDAWHALLEKLSSVVAGYLTAQVEAGAQAVQLFDSWAGALTPQDYREYALPYSRQVFQALSGASSPGQSGVPAIHFSTGTGAYLPLVQQAGGDVIGVDWRIALDQAWSALGPGTAVQGNLDPVALMAPLPELERQVNTILEQAKARPGHIFNLGHGILPETPVENVQAVVDWVHAWAQKENT